jgi:hypothetical protein
VTDRRVDPTGKRALFSAPPSEAPDRTDRGQRAEGRAALFSTPPRRPGTVVIECASCKVRSRVSLTDLAMRFATGSAWNPFRRHPHWVRCPACGGRHWCRVGWQE